jgi:hypothetical protein
MAILFCGGQKVTTRRAWQTEAHPRYGVTRGEELGLEADRAGSGARVGAQLIKGRPFRSAAIRSNSGIGAAAGFFDAAPISTQR